MIRVIAGIVWLSVSFALMYLRVEPFATEFYMFAWVGLIYTVDMLIRRTEGSSLVLRCGAGFFLLLFWSTTCWFFFELLNLRLENWYYIFVSDHELVRLVGSFASFATVLPGIFWIDHYLLQLGVSTQVRSVSLHITPSRLAVFQLLGLVLLASSLLYPTYFFPLVWVGPILIVAPLNYRRGGDSLLRQLESGEYGPTLRILLAGLVAGLFWEFFNYWARAKWIYTVPFFDELKLFEMPLAGFLGFPPFALECAVFYRFLAWHRLAPSFGPFVDQKPTPTPGGLKVAAVVLATVFSLAVYRYMDRWTITSLAPRFDRVVPLDQMTRAALAAQQVDYLTELQGSGAETRWRELASDLDPARLQHLRALTRLYLHQGIGVRYGNHLVEAGIASLTDLRTLTADEIIERLQQVEPSLDLSAKRVRIWIRRASTGGVP
uniref:DUF4332 domain-containing protein n=1 Tax=uncultured nuHF2 cluster bacterium HF0500_31B05 TaxID=723589 RepID=E7C5Y0_9BACT|nr:hypothetical protein [uncultured nuHF2 cluster bacterium HF0500_31B05]